MKIYIFNVTYNFSGNYIAKKCNTYDEALAMLNDFLEKESYNFTENCGYNPSVLKWSEDNVTLVGAGGYSTEESNNHNTENCAYCKIFEVEI